MAALLVGLSVMAVMMSVAMPAWSHMIRRDKEAELVFRGTQYARAINQYQRKFANASPASLDVLIEQRLLRKKFRDPLSPNKDGEFQLLYLQNQSTMGGRGQTQGSRGSGSTSGTGMGGSIGPSPTGRGGQSSGLPARTRGNRFSFTRARPTTTNGSSSEWKCPRRPVPVAPAVAADLNAVDERAPAEMAERADPTAAAGLVVAVRAEAASAVAAERVTVAAQGGGSAEAHHRSADITASCNAGRIC